MSKRGDVYENPVTGERAIIRIGTEETGGRRLLVDLFVRPRGAVPAEHYHPAMRERFTVISGQVGFMINGVGSVAKPSEILEVAPGVRHDWWNAGEDEARVLVDVDPATRFEHAILNGFGFAQDGKTDAKGMPGLLQLSLYATEFDDVIRFIKPPRFLQKVLFALLTPIAKMKGLRGSYPEYLSRGPSAVVGVPPLPENLVSIEREALGSGAS